VVEERVAAAAVVDEDHEAQREAAQRCLALEADGLALLADDWQARREAGALGLVLVAHPSKGINTLGDLLKRAQAEPGKLNYASSGPGTPYHMAGELLKSMARINVVHVPYKGSSGARTDVIGGQVDLMFDAVTTMTEQIKAGKVKALATSGRARSDVMPDVPTLTEAGVPGYEATIWLGIMAPRGTPQPVIDRLNEAISKIVGTPELKQQWSRQGAVPMVMNPAAFTKYLNDDIAKWAGVIKSANIKLD
jgi:tripartite-type tricarboxylate transporter receptor subunit TctC